MVTGMKTALLIPVLIVAACVQQQQLSGPENAAREYVAQTYFNTERVMYSDFAYSENIINSTTAEVTIRFKRVLDAPEYVLTRQMEQIVTTEKKGGAWVAADTPNARIALETYEYK